MKQYKRLQIRLFRSDEEDILTLSCDNIGAQPDNWWFDSTQGMDF
jgi:hypothetical protein